jgi:hypothetical protein
MKRGHVHYLLCFGTIGLPEFRNFGEERLMKEKLYRQSRLCRLLGNPVVYSIVAVLHERGEMMPTAIVEAVGRSLGRVSALIGALRLADVVRYETPGAILTTG